MHPTKHLWTNPRLLHEEAGNGGLIAIFDHKNEAVRKVVEAIKFGFNRDLVGEVLAGWELPKKLKKTILVPVPLHRLRENWRGFNQAELIATHMGKKNAGKGPGEDKSDRSTARTVNRG